MSNYSPELEKAVDYLAESVFYHFTDGTNRDRLKGALYQFADAIYSLKLLNSDKEDERSVATEETSGL